MRVARACVALLWLALAGAATSQLHRLGFDNDTWLPPDNPRKIALDTFRAEFEPDEAFLLVVELQEDFFREEQTQKIRELEGVLDALPETVSVLSPLSATTIIDTGETLEIGSFDEAMEKGFLADAGAFREKFLASPYAGRLLSADQRKVLLRVAIERIDAVARGISVAAVIAAARAEADKKGWENIHFAGESALKDELNRATREQLPYLLALAGIMLVIFLRLACGNWRRAAVIFAAAVAAVSSCLGLMAAFGWPMNAVLLVLPVMVSVIAVADGLHILATWDALEAPHLHDPQTRIKKTIAQTWLPCLGATLTSAAGFGAFSVSELTPLQHFGFASALTILYAYPLITGAVWGSLWIFPGMERKPPSRLPWEKLAGAFERAAGTRPRRIVFAGLCFAALLGGGLSLLRTETNFLAVFFSPQSEVRRAFDLVDADLGGSNRVEVIRRGAPEQFAEHAAMRDVESLAARLREIDTVHYVDSYLLPVGMADTAFGGSGLPESDGQLSQELLFLSLSRSETERGVLAPYLDFNESGARLSLQTANLLSPELERTIAETEAHVAAAPDNSSTALTTTITGFGVFIHNLGEHVLNTQASSLALTFLIIATLLFAQFGWRAGFAGLLANMLPLAATAGLVAWLRYPYDFAAILIAGVTLSLSVDDTIHFLHHYRRGNGAADSRRRALGRTARPIAVTTVLFCCGLGVVAFSDLVVLRRFALFASFGIACALASALLFLPAFLAMVSGRQAPAPAHLDSPENSPYNSENQ